MKKNQQDLLMLLMCPVQGPCVYILTDKRKDTQNICQLIHELT